MSAQTPAEIEQAAAEDVRRADASLVALEERVLADDQDVTPAEIETARSHRHFAGLRQKAAQRKAAKLRAEQQAAEREQALADARAILAEHTDADVAAAEAAASEAMLRLRETVRARNDGMHRALLRLQGSPVPATNEQSAQALGWGRQPYSPDRTFLWIDGQACGPVPENEVMDRARNAPAAQEHAEEQDRQQQAAARLVERDTALYREDRAAFEALPASRRKPVFDALGIDWEQDVARREQALLRSGKGGG